MRRAAFTVVVAISALAGLDACGKQRPFGKNVPADAGGLDGTESGASSPSGMTQDCASTTCTSNPEQLTPAGGLSGANAEGQDSLSGTNSSSADAGAACSAGATERCGPPAEEGACRFGTRTCVDGTWSECMGAVFGSARDCTSAEDNDCDGQPDNVIDDVCRCLAMGARPCDEHTGFDGRGSCRAGTQTCVLGPETRRAIGANAWARSRHSPKTRARWPVTTPTATGRQTAGVAASKAPASLAAPTRILASACAAPVRASMALSHRAKVQSFRAVATADRPSTMTATVSPTTSSTRPARAQSARAESAVLTPAATAMALAARGSKPAKPAPRTGAAPSERASARSVPRSATPAPSPTTTPTATACPTAAASASLAKAMPPAAATRAIRAATRKGCARPARTTATAP
jgi:hypothetical protein